MTDILEQSEQFRGNLATLAKEERGKKCVLCQFHFGQCFSLTPN